MPYNWEPVADGGLRLVPKRAVPDADWEAQGAGSCMSIRDEGPHNPKSRPRSRGTVGAQNSFNIGLHNEDVA